MRMATNEPSQIKFCAGCGLNVSHMPYVTDRRGRTFCHSCHAYQEHEAAHPPVIPYQKPPVVTILETQRKVVAPAKPLPEAEPEPAETPPPVAPPAAPEVRSAHETRARLVAEAYEGEPHPAAQQEAFPAVPKSLRRKTTSQFTPLPADASPEPAPAPAAPPARKDDPADESGIYDLVEEPEPPPGLGSGSGPDATATAADGLSTDPPRLPEMAPLPPNVITAANGQPSGQPSIRPVGDGLVAHVEDQESPTLLACADCHQIFPEREVHNYDGEFLCEACATARNLPPPAVQRALEAKAKRGPVKPDRAEVVQAWKLAGIRILLLMAGTFGLLLIIIMGFHMDPVNLFYATVHKLPLGESLFVAAGLAVLTIFQAVVLLASMVLGSYLFNGLDFGRLETAITKATVIILLGNTAAFLVPGLIWGILLLVLRPVIFIGGLMFLFRVEKNEAFAVSCANSVFTVLLLVVGGITFVRVFGLGAIHHLVAGKHSKTGAEMKNLMHNLLHSARP